jgi:thioredoxin-like negative regulator of GroEL
MEFVPYVLGLLVLVFVAVHVGVAVHMRRLQGRPVPELAGDLGARLRQAHPVLVYFFSPQCPQCAMMTPMVERLARERLDVVFVDITRIPEVARRFGVMVTPTTLAVEGGKVSRVLVGVQSEKALTECAAAARPQGECR